MPRGDSAQPSKHEQRSAATRALLLATARRLFGERGFAAVGTEELVREAGVSRGALYHQFQDKTALFDAVVVELEAEVTAQVAETALATATDPVAALRAGARAFLDVCADPHVERILLLDAPGVLGWNRWREIGEQHGMGIIIMTLQAAMDAGALPQRPVRPLAHLVLGALDEAALATARSEDPESTREQMLNAFDWFLLRDT